MKPYIYHVGDQSMRQASDKIYVIRSLEFCKIGITRSLLCRLQAIEAVNPHPLEVALYEAVNGNARVLEKSVHEALKEKHHNLEWFRCSPGEAVGAVRNQASNLGMSLSTLPMESRPYPQSTGEYGRFRKMMKRI